MTTAMAQRERLNTQARTTGLLLRYWGWGEALSDAERDILLAALDEENKYMRCPTHMRALEELKEKGVQ
jgi:hypothetical protein